MAEGRRPLVIRFTGGPQAAHTVKGNLCGRKVTHVFSSFGSGTLLGVPTLYRSSALIDPICLVSEWNVLAEKGVARPIFDVSRSPIITPYDVEANRNDAQSRSDGTCGKGVYFALRRSQSGVCYTMQDDPQQILDGVAAYYKTERYAPYDEMFVEAFDKIRKGAVHLEESDFDDLIFESTQGLLLDADLGFVPHVTATATGLNALERAELVDADVYLVSRTYLTRHGAGYQPTPMEGYDLMDEANETNVLNEFQGVFKRGIFDFDLLNEAIARHDFSSYSQCRFHWAVTHLDVVRRNGLMYYRHEGEIAHLPVLAKDAYREVAELFRAKCNVGLVNLYGCDSPEGLFEQL